MNSAKADSVAASSEKGVREAVGGDDMRKSSHTSSSSSSSEPNRSAQVTSASTPSSSHTLPRPHERSLTATGRSSLSPPEAPEGGGGERRHHSTHATQSFTHSLPQQHRDTGTGQSAASRRSPPPIAEAASYDVRDTVEYRAAWDLELWKAVQADRFRKQLERQKSLAMADLEEAVKRQEREAKAELARRTRAVAQREEAVKAAEAQLATRQTKATEAEKDLRRMRQQLLEAQQRVEEEVRAQVRLANDTIAHRARLLEERVKAAEAQAQRADERQRQAQQEYLGLYEAFSRYRMQQLTADGAGGGHNLLAVNSTGASSSALSPALQLEQLRAQWDAEHQLQVERLEQRHRAELNTLQEHCRDLEEQNRRLTAALARRREQLRLMRASGAGQATPAAAPPPKSALKMEERARTTVPLPASPPAVLDAATREVVAQLTRELRRLEADRITLVDGSCGAVRETDDVIVRMDARMQELRQQLAAVQGPMATTMSSNVSL